MTLARKSPMKRTAPARSPKPRLKHCAVCRCDFLKQRMGQIVCGPVCAGEAARIEREKKAKAGYRARKEAAKTIPELKKEVEKLCHEYIRLRDHDKPCICCDQWPKTGASLTGGQWDAAHYRSRGSADHLRYDVRNIHRALKNCNKYGHTNYRGGLIARIGLDAVEALESDQTIVKWTREMLIEKKAFFRAEIKALKAKGK